MGILQGTMDLAQCSVTIDGLPIDGFGDGDAVTIEYNAPIYNTTVGADGGYHRANSNDQGGSITFNLMQTSTVSRRLLEGIMSWAWAPRTPSASTASKAARLSLPRRRIPRTAQAMRLAKRPPRESTCSGRPTSKGLADGCE